MEKHPLTDKNHRWIYTYDYAPDSVWEPWRGEVYGEGGLDEDGVPLWIAAEAEAVASRVDGTLPAYIVLADSHYVKNGTWEDTVASMRAVAERVEIRGIVHLGDLTDGLLPLKETERIKERVIRDMLGICGEVYPVPGNHDYNYFRGNPDVFYPERPQYYKDEPGLKLRLIFIDSFDPMEPVRYGFTEYCVHWLDSVLRTMPEGYAGVVFSHVTPLVRLQAWTDDIRNREKLIAVLDKYAGRILAFINGHNHCDHLFNDLNNGQFPIISINCAKCEFFTEHKPEGAAVPFRRLGDRTQESFDIMQVDTGKREIFFTRFGAGKDRYVRRHKAGLVE